jgi:hypothetical protein
VTSSYRPGHETVGPYRGDGIIHVRRPGAAKTLCGLLVPVVWCAWGADVFPRVGALACLDCRLYLMGPEALAEGSLVSTADTTPGRASPAGTLDTHPANRGFRSKKVGPVPGAEPLPRRAHRQSSGPPATYEGRRTA